MPDSQPCLLYFHDDMIELGPDVTGFEDEAGNLVLASPHTPTKAMISDDSTITFHKGETDPVPARPLVERLLAGEPAVVVPR